jgi:hypothetical protein
MSAVYEKIKLGYHRYYIKHEFLGLAIEASLLNPCPKERVNIGLLEYADYVINIDKKVIIKERGFLNGLTFEDLVDLRIFGETKKPSKVDDLKHEHTGSIHDVYSK